MIKLDKPINALENILDRLHEKIEQLEEAQTKIEDRAAEHDRDMTRREQTRYDKLQEQIDELDGEADSIECALDYLHDYADDKRVRKRREVSSLSPFSVIIPRRWSCYGDQHMDCRVQGKKSAMD